MRVCKMTNWLCLGVVAATSLVAFSSHGWIAIDMCNGYHVKWRSDLHISRNRCSIPDSGDINASYWNGIGQWDNLTHVVDNFLVRPGADCSISTGDGINEVGVVDPAYIDHNYGVTRLLYGICFIGPNDIDEADVLVSGSLPFTNPSPTSLSPEGRGTFTHEFGHVLGFADENGGYGAMHQTPRPYTGGNATASVFPTDTMGLEAFYGLSSGNADLITSAMSLFGTSVGLWDSGTQQVCRGDSHTVRFYIGNAGKANSPVAQRKAANAHCF